MTAVLLSLCLHAVQDEKKDTDNSDFILRISDDESKTLLATVTAQKSTQLPDGNLSSFEKPTLTIFNEASGLNDTIIIKSTSGTYDNNVKLLTLQENVAISSNSKSIMGSCDLLKWTKEHSLIIGSGNPSSEIRLKDIQITAKRMTISRANGGVQIDASGVSRFVYKTIGHNIDGGAEDLRCALDSVRGELALEYTILSGGVNLSVNGGLIKCEQLEFNMRNGAGICRGAPHVSHKDDSGELLTPMLEIYGDSMLAYPPSMIITKKNNTFIHTGSLMTITNDSANMVNCVVRSARRTAFMTNVRMKRGTLTAAGGISADINQAYLLCDRAIISNELSFFGSLVLINSITHELSAIASTVKVTNGGSSIDIGSQYKRTTFIKRR